MSNRNDVLLRWQTEEATVRARLAAPGVTSPQDLKESSGIEFLQRVFDGELPSPPIGETLGFVPVAAEPGRVVFQSCPWDDSTSAEPRRAEVASGKAIDGSPGSGRRR